MLNEISNIFINIFNGNNKIVYIVMSSMFYPVYFQVLDI